MVIGKITSIGSLLIIGAVAILFLRQASASSFGHAGQDVGQGLSGISLGISNLFNSFIRPITGLFGSLGNLFSFANQEQDSQAQNQFGYIRNEPTAATSRINSVQSTQSTINNVQHGSSSSSGYTAGAITSHRSTGGFGRAN